MNWEINENPETPELPQENDLGSIQAPSFADMEKLQEDLMPKIHFTGEGQETGETADLPVQGFQNERYNVQVEGFQNQRYNVDMTDFVPSQENAGEAGEAAGEGTASGLEVAAGRIRRDQEHLNFAQQQLDQAIERGTGVMTAMSALESAKAVLEADQKLYNQLQGNGEASEAPVAGKLGSVSHKEWELERAIAHGNQIEIHNAKNHLAEEIAKEEAKKMKR